MASRIRALTPFTRSSIVRLELRLADEAIVKRHATFSAANRQLALKMPSNKKETATIPALVCYNYWRETK